MPSDAAQTAVSRLQPRIPASLYEVAWQYSLLDWFDSSQSDAINWDLDPEHLAYLTPHSKSELFGKSDSLVTVYADLSNPDNPKLRDGDKGPVEISTYTKSDRFRVGHSYPQRKTANKTDHSITTHKNATAHHIAGLREGTYWTNNVRDRFSDWATSEYADVVREETDKTGREILDALAALGNDTEEMESLSDAFLDQVEDEEEELDTLITVAVRPPNSSEYKLPGEVDVLNDVMRAKKAAELESISVENASGEGVGYVTGEEAVVTGGSPGLFGMNGKLQREHFPDLDPKGDEAWRTRALEFETAAAIVTGDSLFGAFYRGLGNNRRLYVLPYLAAGGDDIRPETFTWFYENVYKRLQEAEGGSDGTFDEEVEDIFLSATNTEEDDTRDPFDDDARDWGQVRFAVVHRVTGNPDRVFFDTLDGVSSALQLENAQNRVAGTDQLFARGGIFHESPSSDSSPLLGGDAQLVRYILYGGYFRRTTEPSRSSREAEERPTAGDIDDSSMRRVRNLLTGTDIDATALLEDYIHQLVQDQREQLSDDSPYIAFPRRSVVEQYTQFRALGTADTLDTSNSIPATITMTDTDAPETRSARLDEFINSHDALEGSSAEAVFVLGGLVGRITAYQSYENVSSTLVRRYPIDYLTKQTIKEVTKEVLQMNNSYAEADEQRSYQTNSRYTSRLTDTMLAADPSSWSMTEAELQWLYSLGITYGLNDSSLIDDNQDETLEADSTA